MKIILPNPFLLVAGRIGVYIMIWGFCFLLHLLLQILVLSNNLFYVLALIPILAIALVVLYQLSPFVCCNLVITKKHIIYFGLFLPFVRLKIEDVKFVDVRVFKDGNKMYDSIPAFDAFTHVLLSTRPLPQKRIDKIRSSWRKKLIRFELNSRLSKSLSESLPEPYCRRFDYFNALYDNAKRAEKRYEQKEKKSAKVKKGNPKSALKHFDAVKADASGNRKDKAINLRIDDDFLIKDDIKKESMGRIKMLICSSLLPIAFPFVLDWGSFEAYQTAVAIITECVLVLMALYFLYKFLTYFKYQVVITKEKMIIKTLFKTTEADFKGLKGYTYSRIKKSQYHQFKLHYSDFDILLFTKFKKEFKKLLNYQMAIQNQDY